MKRLWLLLLLALGKAVDALSTVIVLPMSPSFYESVWLANRLIVHFGLVVGMFVSFLLTLVLIPVVAESGEVVRRALPAEWVPDWYADAVRVSIYLVSAAWYAVVGVQNFMLVL